MAANTINSTSGFVIIGDIARFSTRVSDLQNELVLHLWRFLNASPLLRKSSGHQAILNGTGDGALVAFPRNFNPQRNGGQVMHWREALNFARDWAAWMGQQIGLESPLPRLRIGIHQGPFQIVRVADLGGLAKHGGFQIVGKTPNTCARIAGLGDAGHIILSETFVAEWRNTSRIEDDIVFDPPLAEPPMEAFVKHRDSVNIRLLHQRKGQRPERLAAILIVKDQLLASLADVEELFRLLLNTALNSAADPNQRAPLSRATLSARVSVWTLDPMSPHLRCSEIRWHFNKRSIGPSRIRYSIDGDGTGVPGRAFRRDGGRMVVKGLPHVDSNKPRTLQRYCDTLFNQTGLPVDVTETFSCFSRSFVAFTVRLHQSRPDAVICIDAEHPLTQVTRQTLASIAASLQASTNALIASLVRLHLG